MHVDATVLALSTLNVSCIDAMLFLCEKVGVKGVVFVIVTGTTTVHCSGVQDRNLLFVLLVFLLICSSSHTRKP